MKKNYLFLALILFISISTNAQATRIKFTYDDAGNQTRRVVLNDIPAKMATDSIPKTAETITDKDYIDDGLLNGIKYYPNPVKEELFLKWKNTSEKTIASISLYNINGQLLSTLDKLQNSENETINFQSLTQGIYTMLVLYSNGKNETFKIVKK